MSAVSLRARGLAALIVLVLFPVFLLSLIGVLLVGGIWLASKSHNSGIGGHLLVAFVPLTIAVVAAFRDVIKARKPAPIPGYELAREDHPALWAELDGLAAAMSQPIPDRVVVHPSVNAFVTTAAGQREVMIGYPLLAGLSRAQLRSVLAHEMGHLAHGHTQIGGLTYRGSSLMRQTVARLDGGLVRSVVLGYYRCYLLISMSVLRDHERQADEWSARLAGGPDAASVFPTLARLDATWDLLIAEYIPLATTVDARPDLREGLFRLDQGRSAQLETLTAKQLASKPSRWATHPADAERMRRLQAAPPLPSSDGIEEPAWLLLGGQRRGFAFDTELAAAALRGIEAGMLPPGSAPASWQQVVAQAELQTARSHLAHVVGQFTQRMPGRPVTLRELLTVLPSDAGRSLVTPLMRGDLPADRREAALAGVIGGTAHWAILTATADQGRSWLGLRWDGPAQLEYRQPSGEVGPWPEELTPALPLTSAAAARALDRLVQDGVDIDLPLVTDPLAETPVPVSVGGVSAGVAPQLGQPAQSVQPAQAGQAARTGQAAQTGQATQAARIERPATVQALRSITNGAVASVLVRPRRADVARRMLHDILVMDDGLLFTPVGRTYGMLATAQAQYLRGAFLRKGLARLQELSKQVDGDPATWVADPDRNAFWVPYASIQQAQLRKARGQAVTKRLTFTRSDGLDLVVKWTVYSFQIGDVDPVLRAALDHRLR